MFSYGIRKLVVLDAAECIELPAMLAVKDFLGRHVRISEEFKYVMWS